MRPYCVLNMAYYVLNMAYYVLNMVYYVSVTSLLSLASTITALSDPFSCETFHHILLLLL